MRTIGVVTTSRADYGILLPVLRGIAADPALRLQLFVGGMHLAPEFGRTVEAIEADGFPIADRVEMLLASDTPTGTAKAIGLGVIGFAEAYRRARPDLLVVLGDRFEMHAAALAALPYAIPLAHVHGGEVTEGAIDDALRHGITKLAHLHFPATERYARRIVQLGEEPWRITVSGAPSLDNLRTVRALSADELRSLTGLPFDPPPLLVTFHPVTLEPERTPEQIDALLAALDEVALPALFTLPNADAGGRLVADRIRRFVAGRPRAALFENLGTDAYFSAMRLASAMVGNSSSGIIEAAAFELPVVNVGSRQAGRTRGENVVDVERDGDPAAIAAAIRRAASPAFRAALRGMRNPYGRGDAAATIVDRLRDVPLDARLLRKRFQDLPEAAAAAEPKELHR